MPYVARLGIRLLLLIVLLALAYVAVTVNLAAHAVEHDNVAGASRFARSSGHAAAIAAQSLVDAGDPAAATPLAIAAVHADPIGARGIRALGLAIEQSDPARSSALMLQAAQLGWRDARTQMWLIQAALRARNPDVAMQRIDALARQQLDVDRLLPLVHQASADPVFARAVAARLAEKPQWRGRFLSSLATLQPADLPGHERIFEELVRVGSPPTRAELNSYLARLIALKRFAEAGSVASAFAPPYARPVLGGLADGDFSRPASDYLDAIGASPFEWAISSLIGASATIDSPSFRPGDPALAVASDGATSGAVASQWLLLAPGAYRFTVDAAAAQENGLASFRWRLHCKPSNLPIDLATGTRSGDGWHHLDMRFQIPADCPAQLLELDSQPTDLPEAVQGWFDHARISRL